MLNHQMKLQKIINQIEQLHPKSIDLNLSRVKKLCKKPEVLKNSPIIKSPKSLLKK